MACDDKEERAPNLLVAVPQWAFESVRKGARNALRTLVGHPKSVIIGLPVYICILVLAVVSGVQGGGNHVASLPFLSPKRLNASPLWNHLS